MVATWPGSAALSRPAVLVVEDDVTLRRFVSLALEDMALDLVLCESVEEALPVLSARDFRLVVTDLMLPGASGHALLACLAEDPRLGGGPKRVVFSAGVDARTRVRLRELGVWRILSKPISLLELEACVGEALQQPVRPACMRADAGAIERNFAGDAALYAEFLGACLAQFTLDALAGDSACEQGDAASLGRLAHSLKSVLGTLGFEALGDVAKAMEAAALQGDHAVLFAQWPRLRDGLNALADAASPPAGQPGRHTR